MKKLAMILAVAGLILAASGTAQAVDIELVTVGNPGNVGDTHGAGYGAVDYAYNIGKYEVTAGQYREFLSAVAGVDTYGLYNTNMWSSSYGCKIERFAGSGTGGDPYQYQVAADWANRPVNFVSFWDACPFANWLHNGQGSGDTETGAYTLTPGGIDDNTITRNADWKWAVTSEDEWYKAAYHKNDGLTGDYFDYPTSSDSVPSNDLTTPDGGNNANFWQDGGYTVGGPYYRTPVGEFELSESPYGTFDQGGNVREWNEAGVGSAYRYQRGGEFAFYAGLPYDDYLLRAVARGAFLPTDEGTLVGFRVVPEPAAMSVLALGACLPLLRRKPGRQGLGMLIRRKRRA